MQISAQTLLASQQATQIAPWPAPGFAAALNNNDGFAPLPLRQTVPAQDGPAAAQPAPKGPMRLGSLIDIRI
jgi:hypothetical protein